MVNQFYSRVTDRQPENFQSIFNRFLEKIMIVDHFHLKVIHAGEYNV